MNSATRSGFVAIVGRPNVGKSTLLNHILGVKLSITSRKPQTTRHRLLGVYTEGHSQMMFVDTPGLHTQSRATNNAINRYMNQQAKSVLSDVDLCLHVIDARGWRAEDDVVADQLTHFQTPAFCVLNKVDRVNPKSQLLLLLKTISEQRNYEELIPLSALKNEGIDTLIGEIGKHLPEGPHLYEDDEITDRSLSFLASEMIREHVVRQLGDELPYRTAVSIENYEEKENLTVLDAVIYVEKESQKGMVIGAKGKRLKTIGQASRRSLEKFLEQKVYLNLFVRVRRGWTNEQGELAALGYR